MSSLTLWEMTNKTKELSSRSFWKLHDEYCNAARNCMNEAERRKLYKKADDLVAANPERLLEPIDGEGVEVESQIKGYPLDL